MTTVLYDTELVNKFSKYIKIVDNRIVEVEFHWFQIKPYQCYRLRINEEQFNEAQKSIRSKKLLTIQFEKFIDLILPIFANETIEITQSILRTTFDYLFDHNSNGTIELEEFDSLFRLLHGNDFNKQNIMHENFRQLCNHRSNHISFKGLTALVVNNFNLNILQYLTKQGCNIVINGCEDYQRIQRIQNKIINLSVNLQKDIEIYDLVKEILIRFQTIDIVIINHQYQSSYRASIDEFPVEHWRDIINSNLTSIFSLIKIIWPQMKRHHFGRLIHLTNENFLIDTEYQSASMVSQHGLIGLNKAVSIEGAQFGITSNIICKGYTKINTFEQLNHIKTLTDLIGFLCSNQARSINGQMIPWFE